MKVAKWMRIFGLGSIVVIAISLANGSPAWPAQETKPPIKIGYVDSLTGALALTGIQQLQAFKLAVREINDRGGILGRQVDYIVRDDKTNPSVAAREMRDLIDNEKVDFLVGFCASNVALAGSAVAKEKKKILVINGAMASRITEEEGHPYVFRPLGNTHTVAGFVGEVMAKKPYKQYVLMAGDYAWGRDSAKDFEAVLNKINPGATIVERLWSKLGTADFSGFITRAMALNPEIFICFLTGTDAVTFIRQAVPYKVFEKCLVNGIYLDQSYIEAIGKEMPDGLMTYSQFFYNYPGKKAEEFRNKVKKETGLNVGGSFFLGYYPILFLRAAIEKAKTTDTEKVIKAFEGISVDTIPGKVTIRACDHQGDFVNMIGIMKKAPEYEFAIAENIMYEPGLRFLPSCEEVEKLRKKQ
jgi:branched-chain amino acid transport system substrate-binding protein